LEGINHARVPNRMYELDKAKPLKAIGRSAVVMGLTLDLARIVTAETAIERAGAIGGAVGGIICGTIGAVIGGLLLPGSGTPIEGVIGGFFGGYLGDWLGGSIARRYY